MTDSPNYLPIFRTYFRRFKASHMEEYKHMERELGNPLRFGYPRYRHDLQVAEYLVSIVNHLDETFGNLDIPEEFSSPDALINKWTEMYSFMLEKEVLLNQAIESLFEEDQKSEAFAMVNDLHKEVIGCLNHILNMSEVKKYGIETAPEKNVNSSPDQFDVVILTALFDTEFVAFKKQFSSFTEMVSGDQTQYLQGQIGEKRVLVATDDTMGIAASTALTTKVLTKFKPKYVFMGGIAAGVISDEREFGDILIARNTWNYESGKYQFKKKLKRIAFEPSPEQVTINAGLTPLINAVKSDTVLLKQIHDEYAIADKDKKPGRSPEVSFGPMASGSAVVADLKKIEDIKTVNRKLIGIDMETFGVYYGCKSFEIFTSG